MEMLIEEVDFSDILDDMLENKAFTMTEQFLRDALFY